MKLIISALLLFFSSTAISQSCFTSSITSPSPFMGNHDEVFQLADGSFWKVQFEYEYLYEYYPTVTVCPATSKLIVNGKALKIANISPPKGRSSQTQPSSPTKRVVTDITVVAVKSGCRDYFLADGPQGYYLLEWYGGHSPTEGDTIVGPIGGYGFKDIYYTKQGSQGRVWVDDYLLSRSRAIEKYAEKCR